MRKATLTLALAGTFALGGCATYGNDGGLFGDVFGNNDRYDYGYNGRNDFERAAVNACGREASRYGRISINSVNQETRDRVVVTGRTDQRDRDRDQFGCTFDRNGRITDFQLY